MTTEAPQLTGATCVVTFPVASLLVGVSLRAAAFSIERLQTSWNRA
jgi:hypothetical protein